MPDFTRRALLVATRRYEKDALPNLRGPALDLATLTVALEEHGGFDVEVLIDATGQEIQLRVHSFLTSFDEHETALLYYSGHGLRTGDQLWLAGTDTEAGREPALAVDAAWMYKRLTECAAGAKVWILDCCHAAVAANRPQGSLFKGLRDLPDPAPPDRPPGPERVPVGAAGEQGVAPGEQDLAVRPDGAKGVAVHHPAVAVAPAGGVPEPIQGRGLVILSAAFDDQRALDGPQGSIYTRALVQGIVTGAADLDRDGWVSAHELAHYAYERLSVELREHADAVEPMFDCQDGAGRIRLTRAPVTAHEALPAAAPAALPEDRDNGRDRDEPANGKNRDERHNGRDRDDRDNGRDRDERHNGRDQERRLGTGRRLSTLLRDPVGPVGAIGVALAADLATLLITRDGDVAVTTAAIVGPAAYLAYLASQLLAPGRSR